MGARIIGWLARALALLGIVAAMPAAADIGPSGTAVDVCIAGVRPGDTPARMLAARARFVCGRDQRAFGAGDFWVRATRLPPVAQQPGAVVRSYSLWQDRSDLWVESADGHLHHSAFTDATASRVLQLGAMFEYALPEAPTALLWRVEGAANVRGILTGAQITTAAEARATNLRFAALYAAFAGLCLSLLVYNLSLWVALRHRFQLIHTALLTCLCAYSVSSSGALAWAWPAIANNDRLRFNYLLLAATAIAALQFARSFFEERVFAGWLSRATTLVCAALGVSATAFFVLAPWELRGLDRVYSSSFLALLALTAPVLWRAWSQRSNYLWIFAIGWAVPIVFAAVRVSSTFGVVRPNFLLDNSTLASLTIEALLSSIGIAYRVRLLARERDDARAAETVQRLLADTDPLTGLLNRRAFLREAIARGERATLLIVDIDHFKSVNDTLGHDGGDEVLCRVAQALGTLAGDTALTARLGGEEFALLLPPSSIVAADDVLVAIRSVRMPFDLRVTVSIGKSEGLIASERDWSNLYHAADAALFAAKSAGRDRYRERALSLAA